MKKYKMIKTLVHYCDACGKEIEGSYGTATASDGKDFHVHGHSVRCGKKFDKMFYTYENKLKKKKK
jgi:hypothetical protein